MSNQLMIRKVETTADYRAFFTFPWVLYRDDPCWVPPLVSMRRDLLDRKRNLDWHYLEGDYYAAWRGDQIVGTIAAFINHRHNEAEHEHTGWFGAFDVYDDEEAATALLDTAAAWAQACGCEAIVGPQTFTTHGECGILVDGFTRPVLLMPYNYPYYGRLVEAAGFQKKEDLYSVYLSAQGAAQTGLLDRLQRITRSAMKRNHITIRQMDRHRRAAEFELFKELYNTGWDDTGGHYPITTEEVDALVKALGSVVDPDFAFFAYVNDEPAGFIMGIPDFNQVLQKAEPHPGIPEFITLLRAAWFWKVERVINWIRIALLGVKQAYRGKGVDVALYSTLVEACLNSPRIDHSDSGWISENNTPMIRLAENLGLERYKTHRLYEKRGTA